MGRFEPNRKEIEKLLRSEEVQKALQKSADQIARKAGPGHKVDVYQGFDRARAMIWTASPAARAAEANDRNLTRSVDAGRI